MFVAVGTLTVDPDGSTMAGSVLTDVPLGLLAAPVEGVPHQLSGTAYLPDLPFRAFVLSTAGRALLAERDPVGDLSLLAGLCRSRLAWNAWRSRTCR